MAEEQKDVTIKVEGAVSQYEAKEEETPFEVEEVNPMEMINLLERDLQVAVGCLRKVVRANPAALDGGPNNKWFGNRYAQALDRVQTDAMKALVRMETTIDEEH
jgi:hypothetical protein